MAHPSSIPTGAVTNAIQDWEIRSKSSHGIDDSGACRSMAKGEESFKALDKISTPKLSYAPVARLSHPATEEPKEGRNNDGELATELGWVLVRAVGKGEQPTK